MECFIFCSFRSFKITLLLVTVSPVRAFFPCYANWIYAFFMTNLLINTLPQIFHTTLYLARKKSIYTIPTNSQPENIPSLCQTVPKVVYDLGLVETDVHRESIIFAQSIHYSWINLVNVTKCWMERLNLMTKKLKDFVKYNLSFISVDFCLALILLFFYQYIYRLNHL